MAKKNREKAQQQRRSNKFDPNKQYTLAQLERMMTTKQKLLCRAYVTHWNKTKAAISAGYSEKSASAIAIEALNKPLLQRYCDIITGEFEKLCEVSKAKVVQEHMKIAFSSFQDLQDGWMDLKDFEDLTDAQKSCIKSVERNKTEFGEKVKIELHSKQNSLDAISKLLGYYTPEKQAISVETSSFLTLMKQSKK